MRALTHPQSRPYARLTGLMYLIIAAAGFFSILHVPGITMVASDPAATAAAVAANRGLFDLGIIGEVVIILAELMATTMLYFMFKPVNPTLSLVAAFARLSMAIVLAVMLFFSAIALDLLAGGTALGAFTSEQTQQLAYLFFKAHDFGVVIWQIFFTVHLFILGLLVFRSGVFPRILGLAMMTGSIGYIFDSMHKFMLAGNETFGIATGVLLAIVTLGEISFALWLLIKGPKSEEFKALS
jgi:hypothetical protein